MDDTNNQLDVNYLSEWHCKTFYFQKFILITSCIFFLIILGFCWYIIDEGSEVLLMALIVICFSVVLFMLFGEKRAYSVVHFTPEHIMVDGKKVDISQLSLLRFMRYAKNHYNNQTIMTGLEFMMRFKVESGIKKDIKFVMTFGGLTTNLLTYNYRDRFIKVIWSWVAAKE